MKRRSPLKDSMATRNSSSSIISSGTPSRKSLNSQFLLGEEEIITSTARFRILAGDDDEDDNNGKPAQLPVNKEEEHNDTLNYVLLVVLYTLQGIPMGLSASIPFLIQQKAKQMAASAAVMAASSSTTGAAAVAATAATAAISSSAASRLSYKANAVFALCSWPFSLKLLWAPVVDACFVRAFGRRKTWLVPAQAMAGCLMVLGAPFVQRQFETTSSQPFHVAGITAFFLALYFLMATQDIAVDGWALTMLSKKNRGRGPVCNSIGQNIGYFISFVGFLALNDAESCERFWRPLLRLPPSSTLGQALPTEGLVSLGGFVRFMGYFMIITTTAVAIFKHEYNNNNNNNSTSSSSNGGFLDKDPEEGQQLPLALLASDRMGRQQQQQASRSAAAAVIVDDEHELDASEIGLKETYHRLWAVCKLKSVQSLFVILFTYRLPTALGDNVKFLKAVELGLSKSTTALLSPTVILPIGILVPILATKYWHGHPLKQFMAAYKVRVTLVPLLDALLMFLLKRQQQAKLQQDQYYHSSFLSRLIFWSVLIASTAAQAVTQTLQFNAQMTFFAHRVDPAIGGSYMTLLNTAANLGGTWPASFVMWLVSRLVSVTPAAATAAVVVEQAAEQVAAAGEEGLQQALLSKAAATAGGGSDHYFALQLAFSCLGLCWIWFFEKRVAHVADLPDDVWRTHLLDDDNIINKQDDDTNPFAMIMEDRGILSSSTGRSSISGDGGGVDVELGGTTTKGGVGSVGWGVAAAATSAATTTTTSWGYGGKRE